ncbi:MAG: starvation-inducible DNA-binding protein [Halanaerobium sp. 4-GBenrich]|jgi:starvation-inducible DNA-binding protein|uniref:Starvation-inducible DNA-binding protein n=1 Tax=Halanaerobium congolense TaxID=54121 RepID=A0A1G6RNZ6_9FIRM|nr:DNA starvation/stationary phase protection protein [Halanaerobium congolense]ODS50191.1 MAG: starvation-inducible DNA-binding protein [Halanaerobium sp. 4-GBenrich]OEG61963.1 MAG: DNA starvation/stationary phase protection protein [Halanaerobium sp. MDAL1]PUU90789.1 MAG: starvation-inducible DNA-binding protein [Halanaerobium sp.]PTX17755.1 starvation-inducible DNA-binding protein [Halanaerobium congolense]PUU93248.1 MAG: starvation-inducible DNA-binding protein [Halanaerobium sp.]
MKDYKKMNTYLANLAVLNTKLHNLHWNVEGKQFMQVHNFTEELYDDFFEKYDEVAEIMKMKGEFPLVKLSEYQEAATVEELDSKKYGVDEVLNEVLADLKEMKKLATEIRNDADQVDDFEVVGAFEDHVAGYSQNIWFVRSILA